MKEKTLAIADFLNINENDVKILEEMEGDALKVEALDNVYLITDFPIYYLKLIGEQNRFFFYESFK